MCVEDAAVMACLLAECRTASDYEAAFAVFDAERRERGHWLVQSSRRTGNLYDWMDPECGSDADKIRGVLEKSTDKVWNIDTNAMMQETKERMRTTLSMSTGRNSTRI